MSYLFKVPGDMLANDKFALEDQLRLFGAALDVADAVPVPHLSSALRVSAAESRLARNSSFKKGLEEVYRDVALSKPSWNNGIVTINNEIGGTLKAIGECPHECATQVSDAIAHLKETRGLKEGDALREFEKKYAEVKAEQGGINRGAERWQEIAETNWRITCENGGRLRGSSVGFGLDEEKYSVEELSNSSNGCLTIADKIDILIKAAKEKGNYRLGQATTTESDEIGKAWVGANYTVASDGKTLVSEDRLRNYRPPSKKSSRYASSGIQSNLVRLEYLRSSNGDLALKVMANGHLNIVD